jgi:RNA polymerase sigma-70 factor (ECF subfamily)
MSCDKSQADLDDDTLAGLDPGVIASLVENHRRFLRFLEKRVSSTAVAEEILQGAFVKTLEKGAALQDGEGAVAWFFRLLRNALVDHYRRQDVERRALEKEAREPALPAELDREIEEAVCKCIYDMIPTLRPEYAALVRRVDLEGQSISEIAKAEGISSNNAMVKLHRARQALKRQLERSCGTCAAHGCLDCSCGGARKS